MGVIRTAWTASGAASEDVLMLWDNTAGDTPDEDGTTTDPLPYARTTIRHTTSPRITIVASPLTRYQTEGVVTVEIYTARGDGHTLSDTLAAVVLGALRGHSGSAGGVWFFDISPPQEIGTKGPWFQVNVSASFRYQERG